MPAKDIHNLKPGSKVYAYLVPKTYDGSVPPKSPIIEIDVPTTNNGQRISSTNESVEQHVYGDGSLVSGSSGGPQSQVGTMYIDGTGLHAYNLSGASTVFISSEDGSAYFSGSIVSGAGSIGGWSIAPGKLYADNGTASNYVAISSSGNNDWAFWAGSSDPNTAPFRVKKDGTLVSTSASFSVADIGGWHVGYGELDSGNIHLVSNLANPQIYIGSSGSSRFYQSDTPFYVDSYGRFSLGNQVSFTPSATYGDDFGALVVNGKIRGAIENVTAVPSNKLSASITSASTGINTASLTTTSSTAFLTGENIIVSGLSGNASEINGTYTITMINPSVISITKSTGSWTYQGATYSSITDATAVLRELTMGLHPQESISTNSWYHSAGIGIRLDPYNWWFTNNQFRIGDQYSYFKWADSQLKVRGTGDYFFELGMGSTSSNTYMAIYKGAEYLDTYSDTYTSSANGIPSYSDDFSPFYVDATGKFSLGSKLTWNSASSLLTVRGTGVFDSGSIGGWIIGSNNLYSYNSTASNYVQLKSALTPSATNYNFTVSYGSDSNGNLPTSGWSKLEIGSLYDSASGWWGDSDYLSIPYIKFSVKQKVGSYQTNMQMFGIVPDHIDSLGYNPFPSAVGSPGILLDDSNGSLGGWITSIWNRSIGMYLSDGSSGVTIAASDSLVPGLELSAYQIPMNIYATGTGADMQISAQSNLAIESSLDFQLNSYRSVTTNGYAIQVYNDYSSITGNVFRVKSARASSSAFYLITADANDGADPKFKVRGNGEVTADGSFTGGGADYAEMFEWIDGNINSEDRVGIVVAIMENANIQEYDPRIHDESKILGVVSSRPSVLSRSEPLNWANKYLKDEWGREIYEEYHLIEWEEVENFNDSKSKNISFSYQYDQIPEGIVIPKNHTIVEYDANGNRLTRRKINPDFNVELDYIPRSERKEWAAVGLLGVLRIRKDQHKKSTWIKLRDINDNVEEWLVK